jgi:hypothetical protein
MPARKETADWVGVAFCVFLAVTVAGVLLTDDRKHQRDHEARMQGCAVTQEAPDAR